MKRSSFILRRKTVSRLTWLLIIPTSQGYWFQLTSFSALHFPQYAQAVAVKIAARSAENEIDYEVNQHFQIVIESEGRRRLGTISSIEDADPGLLEVLVEWNKWPQPREGK